MLTTRTHAPAAPVRLHASHGVPLALAGLTLLGAAGAVSTLTPAGIGYPAAVALAYLPVAGFVALTAPGHHPHARFGAANAVTLARAALACLAAGLIATPAVLAARTELAWAPSALAALAILSDLVDGWLARRQGLASAFGARFDIEIDAGLTLVLASLAAALGTIPPWVLLIGLMHYLFLAAGWAIPALAAPLPPSLRRRLIGGSQTLALGVALAPTMPTEAVLLIPAAALSALAVSFALDVTLLIRRS